MTKGGGGGRETNSIMGNVLSEDIADGFLCGGLALEEADGAVARAGEQERHIRVKVEVVYGLHSGISTWIDAYSTHKGVVPGTGAG